MSATSETKLNKVKALLGNNLGGVTDNLINACLDSSKQAILNRLYPFGIPTSITDVPDRYEELQYKIAVYLVSKNGAEGEKVHNENGIQRSYESSDIPNSYLNELTPFCGGVL